MGAVVRGRHNPFSAHTADRGVFSAAALSLTIQ